MSTVTTGDFNEDVSAAKRSAMTAPVIITERGKSTHVLLSIELYRQLVHDRRSTWTLCPLMMTSTLRRNGSTCP